MKTVLFCEDKKKQQQLILLLEEDNGMERLKRLQFRFGKCSFHIMHIDILFPFVSINMKSIRGQ